MLLSYLKIFGELVGLQECCATLNAQHALRKMLIKEWEILSKNTKEIKITDKTRAW